MFYMFLHIKIWLRPHMMKPLCFYFTGHYERSREVKWEWKKKLCDELGGQEQISFHETFIHRLSVVKVENRVKEMFGLKKVK